VLSCSLIPSIPLDGFPEHAGEKLRHRDTASRGQYARLTQVLFRQGQRDVLISHCDYLTIGVFHVNSEALPGMAGPAVALAAHRLDQAEARTQPSYGVHD